MPIVKRGVIWLAWGLVPAALVLAGLLPDGKGPLPRLLLPMFMAALFLWLLAGLVMVATWQEHRISDR
ncbi:hypothetical protein [Pedococcus sp.]|jgi:hypothetical protein|uniref:hypothetical protein n=1 Tax=Pedococcus sp. TaxID=2860345 RepID=UPI002E13FC7A|nr:hypothetical protein [Pedococcus sp.]